MYSISVLTIDIFLDYKRLEEFMQEMAKLKNEKHDLLQQNVVSDFIRAA